MQLKLLAKFKKYHQKSAEQAKKRQQNWIRIVEKLVQEYQMKKPPKPKQKPKEQGFEELLIVGTKIKLETEPEVVESEPDLVVEAQVEAASPKKGPAKKLKAPKQKTKQSKAKKPKTTKAKPKVLLPVAHLEGFNLELLEAETRGQSGFAHYSFS